MASRSIIVKPLGSIEPDISTSKAHHVGNPPTSFRNPWPSAGQKHTVASLLQQRFGNNADKTNTPVPTGPNGTRSEELVKVRKPHWGVGQTGKLRATWIGHASFLVETPVPPGAQRGVRIMFDPVFAERTSPVGWAGPKRYTPTPCTVQELPEVDLVCISHNHYDHLDLHALAELYKKQQGRIHFFAGLGNKSWFAQNICQGDEATELDWWDSVSVIVPDIGGGEIKLTCTPTQHFSGRAFLDHGKTLWCSWALETAKGRKLYFAGDTAYQAINTPSPCPSFKQIGAALGPFDLAMLPIGLCTPASFMGGVHATPEQSLEIHKEIKSKLSVGMHYGTVRGGISGLYEDVRDPPKRWRVAAEKEGKWCGGGVEGSGAAIDVSSEGVGLIDVGETVMV